MKAPKEREKMDSYQTQPTQSQQPGDSHGYGGPNGRPEHGSAPAPDLKRVSGADAAVALLSYLGLSFVLGAVAGGVLAAFGVGMVSPTGGNVFLGVSALSALGAAAVTIYRKNGPGPRAVGLVASTWPWLAVAVAAALAVRLVVLPVGYLWTTVTGLENPLQEELVQSASGAALWQVAFAALIVVVVVPPAEELLFRGVVYGWMRSRWGVAASVGASSLVFGLFHGLVILPVAALFGVVLALVYERSGSLWPAIGCHAVINLSAVVIGRVMIEYGLT